ncbi:TPA: tail fiber domain-containing protein [Pseudomonas putida]|nr:tail fiber domain-containing protein [Pseudomonas putida]
MTDQTQRHEIATVKAEIGSNILSRFSNDPIDAEPIPTASGDIKNLKQEIFEFQEEASEELSIATTVYPTVAEGLVATPSQAIFLVQSADADEIYKVWQSNAGTAVDTGKTAMSSQAVQDALDASNESAIAAEAAAALAGERMAGFLAPSAAAPAVRDNGFPLETGDRYLNLIDGLEYIYKSGGWAANNLDGQIIGGPNGSTMVGNGVRNQSGKNHDILSVRDKIDTAINGTTLNHEGIQAAVLEAYTDGKPLLWPRGVYVKDPARSIDYFHLVEHWGPGVLKSGDQTWVISGKTGVNTVYIDPAGNDENDGLNTNNAKRTVQAALDLYKSPYIPAMLSGNGQFRLKFSAGTWPDGGSFSGQITAKNYSVVEGTLGPDGNTPVTIIDGATSTKTAGIYFDGGPSSLRVSNIWSKNFRSNSVASGFVFANKGISRLLCDNLYSSNNLWAGINADSIGQFYMWGGDHDGNNYYNIRVRGGVQISVGRPDQRKTFLRNSVTSVQIRDSCTGHFDYVEITNHPTTPQGTGIWVTNCSRVTYTGVVLKNCSVGTDCGAGSTFSPGDIVYNNVPTRFRCNGNGAQDRDVDRGSAGGQGWSYDSFFDRYFLGDNVAEINPPSSTAFAYASQKTGQAAWAHLVPRATVAQQLFGNPDGNAIFRRDYDFANSRIQDLIQGTPRLRVTATDVNPVQDNASSCGTPAARWTVVHAATPTIATSDENYKCHLKPIDDLAIRAWSRVEYMQYKFKDSVEEKGDGARWHFGVVAQRVKEAFEAEGGNAHEYGVLCYDEWPAEPATYAVTQYGNIVRKSTGEVVARDVPEGDGSPYTARDSDVHWIFEREETVLDQPARPAGSRYGIRYEEALVLECAYLRSKLNP